MPPRKPRTIHPLFANVARAKVMDKSGYYEYHNSPSPSATATTVMVDDDNPQGSAIDSAESSSMIGGTKRINYFGLDEESSDEEVDEERRQSIINGKRKADEQLEPLPNPNQRAFIQLPQPTLLERQDRNLDISVKIGLREQGAVTRASAIDPEFESPQNNKSLESKTKVEFREAQAMVRAQGVRVDTLRDSSKKSYERYIRHWKVR
ncbi:hypothetical protein BCR41DRAFT_26727 [Lobosporangium transversale]|uniref:Uncharacterized protein n=1 Tax=Lobosporangium transversale TaxID=64571 RepID=A0A1Y2GRT5_9FUNG|nr:hypothetical protein BCR41DRAFT_26727 [Lobosporangium transversale]ORZ20850.1 hypothetical protein BCR41DRAFT_26727 [Lobosporangium transversale]|eukprot:XP_021882759.1 hypothetical protein BCR41DRAFT_26727 [Lobosporangium transversale]